MMRDDKRMRTTLDIDEDVLLAAKKLAEQRGTTAGKELSHLARKGLRQRGVPGKRNRVPLFPTRPGVAAVTLELVNRLRDETP